MLQVFIIVCAVITFIVMAADPRHSQQDQAVSAWQKLPKQPKIYQSIRLTQMQLKQIIRMVKH